MSNLNTFYREKVVPLETIPDEETVRIYFKIYVEVVN